MRIILLFMCLATIMEGALNPESFFYGIQRFGRDTTQKYLEKNLFHNCYGIAMVKPRGTNTTLLIASDPDWCRLIYAKIYEQGDSIKYLRQFGECGSGSGKFFVPKGLCIDTTVYSENSNVYSIYVADSRNNRILKLIYYINLDIIIDNGIFVSGLKNPTNVDCASKVGGGAYVVVVEADTHRIRLYERDTSGTISFIQCYGSRGSGYGEFFRPNGVAICSATDGQGGYFIYVADTGNRRVVCLRYKPAEGITWVSQYKTLEDALFLSVAASQYYCVYVTDFLQNKIWVFTHGLSELLYTYGDAELFNGPKDIYIDWDRLGITERWTATTGLQHFKIIPEIRDFYPDPNPFDATEDSVEINFRVEETKHYLTMKVAGVELFKDQGHNPGSYSVYWNGRDSTEKVALPDTYTIRIYCEPYCIARTDVIVKGNQVAGTISGNTTWTEEGEPYVLMNDVLLGYDGKLVIDAGVKVMPIDSFVLKIPAYVQSNGIFAHGTSSNKILFTPHRKLYPEPDTVSSGFWKGIYFHGGSQSDSLMLEHCIIEVAGYDTAAIQARDWGQVIMNNCEIKKSGNYGYYENDVRALRDMKATQIDSCNFTDNDSIPIRIAFSSICEVKNNTFTNNNVDAIEVVASERKYTGTIQNQGMQYWLIPEKYSAPDYKFQIHSGTTDSCITLTIEPGVQLFFADSTTMEIGSLNNWRGKIIAEGSENDSIYFSALDTTNGWRGLYIISQNSADICTLKYCEISSGGQHHESDLCNGNIRFYNIGTPFILEHSKISKSKGLGFGYYMGDGLSYYPKIDSNAFLGNDSFPVEIPANALRDLEGNDFLDNKHNEIYVRGERINKSLTWKNQGVPYVVDGDIDVDGHEDTVVTLEIESGNIIKFKEDCQLNINSNDMLLAHSTNFTCADSSSWAQIQFINADTSIIDSCVIEHSHYILGRLEGAICVRKSPVKITHSAITNNTYGVGIIDSSGVELKYNQITLNENGVYVNGQSNVLTIIHNDFSGNKCAFQHDTISPHAQADSNWWGDASGPWDPSDGPPDANPTGKGDSISDGVVYRPWRESPVSTPGVTLIQPNGGDTLYSGHDYEIQWNRTVEPIKQELYYTTDYPEGGDGRDDDFWKLIDSIAVSETSYVWAFPLMPSNWCRVAIKIYYEETGGKLRSGSARNDRTSSKSDPIWLRTSSNTSVDTDISDSNFTILDGIPPSTPYVFSEKSENDVIFTWNKITTDTVGNPESMDYYVVYRDTAPSFVPSSTDSIGAVLHPDTTYTDSSVLDSSESYYYLIMAVDSSSNKSKKSNMGYVFHRTLIDNSPTATNRNWVSLPWYSGYNTVSDLTTDLSPSGDPVTKITNLRDDQLYESYRFITFPVPKWEGVDFAIIPGRGYEMVTKDDVADPVIILVGSNDPDGLVSLNENDPGTDRNWVSIPYNAVYSTVSDITDEYCPSGDPVTKITNMRDDQLYESYRFVTFPFPHWEGLDFDIISGRGYEFVATKDSTWNPTEWSNEAKGFFMVGLKQPKRHVNMYIGASTVPDRAPVWLIDNRDDKVLNKEQKKNIDYRCADLYKPNTITSKNPVNYKNKNLRVSILETSKNKGEGESRDDDEERKISHTVYSHLDAKDFMDIVFTTYRLNSPLDVLTENMVGSGIVVTALNLGDIFFDVGNFKTPWKGGEKGVFIVEATKNGKPYYDIIEYRLNDKVDIQKLRDIELKPYPLLVSNNGSVFCNKVDDDNVLGYSLYQDGKRLNEKILTKRHYRAEGDVNLKLVIKGGYETVYGSRPGAQSTPDAQIPIFYAFNIAPNPFSKQTHIDYALPKQTLVEIVIYDVSGREVTTLVSEIQNPGYYSKIWNGIDDKGRKVSSGIYFIRFKAGEFRTQDKMLLVK